MESQRPRPTPVRNPTISTTKQNRYSAHKRNSLHYEVIL